MTSNLFQYGDFKLSSGITSKWKIECDALTVFDLRALAFMAFKILPRRFYIVDGVPTGGLLFAEAMRQYATISAPTLIVDDVLTTGASMERMKASRTHPRGEPMGLVIFARGPCPPWVQAIFQLPKELWI